jgi:pantoate--beta-alanine ligase
MSSRNRRLLPEERKLAPDLFATLLWVRENAGHIAPRKLEIAGEERLNRLGFKPEYLRIAHTSTLQPVEAWEDVSQARVFVAAHLGNVRLIDNLEIIP